MSHALYPGSFDPLHNGHLDIITRASRLYEKLTVAVLDNSLKPAKLFAVDVRLEIIRDALKDRANVEVNTFEGLLVNYAMQKKATVILKGLRTATDFEYEMQMAHMNRHMQPQLDTVFLISDPQWTFVSSTRIREVSSLGVDVAELVPEATQKALQRLKSKE